ncbi:hypothetical protein GCM10009844_20210 [Nocardioides koreensis]|uniref:HTH luxR-type domain-containing protein n=1 Tax=Nocardioides koreensis TaxID=433651 RepID=A0ABP5LHW9_9ACTN
MSVSPVRLTVIGANGIVARGVAALAAEFPDRLRMVPYPWPPAAQDPDVVLYDAVGLHTGDGHDLDLLVSETAAAVLVLAREARPDLTGCALARGADGWVSLEADDDELLAAIESAAAGSLEPESGTPDAADSGLRLPEGVSLSSREAEMLGYIAQDLRNTEIAERCFLSVNSVKTYIRSAYRKIEVNNRAQAVLWWVQHGAPQP